MPKIVVLGAGPCGLATAMMLSEDGHDVLVLERDDQPVPASVEEAWTAWERRGVAQFRQAHYLHPRGWHVLNAELPAVKDTFLAAGATRYDALATTPPFIEDRAPRPGDERFVTVTGRRSMMEHAFASVAEKHVEVRRGVAATELITGTAAAAGTPHVRGVRTVSGEEIAADLVVDAMGRRSSLPELLRAIGARPVHEEAEDSGFTYYTRYFRSRNGDVPQPITGLLTPLGSFSLLTLPGDNETWSVTIFTSSRDRELKGLREPEAWMALISACPLHAHWLDGQPMSDVLAMSGVIDRYRRITIDGEPVATGVLPVADAWACTNPSLGRGIAMGLMHAVQTRSAVRDALDDPVRLVRTWDFLTESELTPWYRGSVEVDRARLAEVDALRQGRPAPPPADPAAKVRAALFLAMAYDAEVFRGVLEIISLLALPQEVLARPGMLERVMSLAETKEPMVLPAPTRDDILRMIA